MAVTFALWENISVFTGTGIVSTDEIVEAMDKWYPTHPTENVIYDFTNASLSGVDADAFQQIAATGNKYVETRGGSVRAAILAEPGSMNWLLLAAYAARVPSVTQVENRLFAEFDEAVAWLTSARQ